MAPPWVWFLFGISCGATPFLLFQERLRTKAARYDFLCQEQLKLQREATPSSFAFPSEFGPMLEAIQRSLIGRKG